MKDIITVQDIQNLDFNKVIIYAAPVMFALVLLEFIFSERKKKDLYNGKDFLASASIGIINLILNAFMKVGVFATIVFFYNLSPFRIPHTWWSYVVCLIVLDLCRYWAHRIAHEQRFWWSTHVVHHNSTYYNLAVSFRLSWTQNLKIIFFLPVVMMGFDPFVFFIIHQIEVLYQFWIHTEFIRKLPKPIEYIFTTPSHHRVHHSTNPQYMDKNYGSTFIIWDRIFGTFIEEEEKPIYGITTPINSYNPVVLVFHAWKEVFVDLYHCRSPKAAFKILFGSPARYYDRINKKFGEHPEEESIKKAA